MPSGAVVQEMCEFKVFDCLALPSEKDGLGAELVSCRQNRLHYGTKQVTRTRPYSAHGGKISDSLMP